jgi:capsular exopolysaccharide synthesis family protein
MSVVDQSIAPYLLRPVRKRVEVQALPEIEGEPLHELWGVFARRWKVIVITVLVVLGAVGAYCLLAPRWYTGQATVMIEGRAPQVFPDQPLGQAEDAFSSMKYDYYQTQFQLLKSPSLARRVIDELGLARDARFTGVPVDQTTGEQAAAQFSPALVTQYLKLLTVLPVRGTRLVTLMFDARDPDLAADVVNAHARLFVRGGLERLYGAMDQMRGFLQTKLAELQDRMQEADSKLMKFQAEHHLLPIDLSKDVGNERLMDLSRRLTAAEAERITLEAQYDLVRRHEYESLPAVLASPLIQKLREDYDRLEAERALLAGKFREAYPQMRQLSAQLGRARKLLDNETANVAKGVEHNYRAAERTAEQLKGELEKQRQSLLERKDAEGELLTLTREAETTRALYDNILQRVKSLSIAGGADASNVSVAEPALPPRKPSSPAPLFDLLLGFAASLVLGTGLAFLRDSWDRTIRDAQDVRRVTGLGTLAIVPDFDASALGRLRSRTVRAERLVNGRNGGNHHAGGPVTSALVLGNGAVTPLVEAYRTLRTALLLSRATSPRVILVASAAGGEGKTTTAVNAAVALAGCGANVLLIDADLRLPRCHEALEEPEAPGLTEYLAGEVNTPPFQVTRFQSLTLLAAGRQAANPTELLTCWRLPSLLREARERFDFVVIDSPPVLAVSDGLLLADLADGVVFVAEPGRSRQDDVRVALQRLQQTGAVPLGAVLNRGNIEPTYYRYYGREVVARADEERPPSSTQEPAAVDDGPEEAR